MGKNQAYKAMQKARLGANAGAPEEVNDGMVDGSFHSPEWHAARLASLNKSHTVTWEEFKRKQKEEEMKKGELEADKDRMMQEYRAQLDAERAIKLSRGRNHLSSKSRVGKDKKDKDSKKHRSKKRKHSKRYSDSSSSSSSSESSSSDGEYGRSKSRSKKRKKVFSSSSSESSSSDDESGRTKLRSKRRKKEKKHRSRSKQCSVDKEGADGPLPLSRFFGSVRN